MRLQRAEVRGSHPASRLPVWQPRARPPQVGPGNIFEPARLVRDRRARLVVVHGWPAQPNAMPGSCAPSTARPVPRRIASPCLFNEVSDHLTPLCSVAGPTWSGAAWWPEPRRLQRLDVQVARDARKHRSRPRIRPAQATVHRCPPVQSNSSLDGPGLRVLGRRQRGPHGTQEPTDAIHRRVHNGQAHHRVEHHCRPGHRGRPDSR